MSADGAPGPPGEGSSGPQSEQSRRRILRLRAPGIRETGLARRFLGVPWLFAIGYSAVGFSLYFALGVVADRGLGLTPLIFLGAGLLFMLATFTYAEGGAMYRERGGSSELARHAFNELVSFIAGWALLIDYVIVVALAAVSVPHYLTPIWDGLGVGVPERVVAVAVVVAAAALNIAGITGQRRQRPLVALALADLLLQVLVIVVGVIVVWDPASLTANLDLFSSPTAVDVIYALVIATVAFAGIEAASDLAPDLEWEPRELNRTVFAGAALLPLVYAGVALVALMVVPVAHGAHGLETPLATRFIDAPVLGVVDGFSPAWLSDVMKVGVVVIAPTVLFYAASTAMLGLSRHTYALATHRQIPSWLGKLGRRHATPHVAIVLAAVIAVGLVLPGDIRFLAGVYAFGATLAIAIAHISIVRLRVKDPERERTFRVPLNVTVGGNAIPLPAVFGAVVTGLAWVSVVVYHDGARFLGLAWMAIGIVGYVVYRRVVQGTSLTMRVAVPAEALAKEVAEAEYGEILVPVFGTKLDDEIVSTAGRLAAAAEEETEAGEGSPRLEVVYVLDLPLTLPLGAPPPPRRMEVANAALERATQVGGEYETVEVNTVVVKARDVGAGIVQAARDFGAQVIVMGGEPPTRIRGGATLGGIAGSRPDEVGPVTEYVLRKAPCPVLLTAPAAE